MKDYLFYTLIGCILFFSSCEKVEFVPEKGTPVFIASIPFSQSDSVGFNAGDDLYYMYTSHSEIGEEIVYSGLFGKEDICEDGCAENFAIQFHQKIDKEAPLSVGNYEFYSVPREGFKHIYTLITNDSSPLDNSTWRVGNSFLSGETISIDSDNDTAPGDDVRLVYQIPNVLTVQFERLILPMTVDCDIQLEFTKGQNGIEVEVVTSSPFAQVSWSDGTLSKKITLNPNISTYSARVFAGSGCTTDISFNIQDFDLDQDYTIGFNQNTFGFATPENPNNAISISYTDPDGIFFTSSTIGQILPFRFDVSEISEYDVNELGDPTWRITADFDCILFGENGKTKRIKNGNAVFAVSY